MGIGREDHLAVTNVLLSLTPQKRTGDQLDVVRGTDAPRDREVDLEEMCEVREAVPGFDVLGGSRRQVDTVSSRERLRILKRSKQLLYLWGKKASVTADASFNLLGAHPKANIGGHSYQPIALPISLPRPLLPQGSCGGPKVVVGKGQRKVLAPGTYGGAILKKGSKSKPAELALSGGEYIFSELDARKHSRLECLTSCSVLIAHHARSGPKTYLGPSKNSGKQYPNIELFIVGHDGKGKKGKKIAKSAYPKALRLGARSEVHARLFVPHGTATLGAHAKVEGVLAAREVWLSKSSSIVYAEH